MKNIFNEEYEEGFPDVIGWGTLATQISVDEAGITFIFPDVSEKPLKSFSFSLSFKPKIIQVKAEDILEIDFEEENYRSAGKTATGAIIGGLLTGGIGLIAGAAIGGKERKRGFFNILLNYKGEECLVVLKLSKTSSQLFRALKKANIIKS